MRKTFASGDGTVSHRARFFIWVQAVRKAPTLTYIHELHVCNRSSGVTTMLTQYLTSNVIAFAG